VARRALLIKLPPRAIERRLARVAAFDAVVLPWWQSIRSTVASRVSRFFSGALRAGGVRFAVEIGVADSPQLSGQRAAVKPRIMRAQGRD
jgi:hypothetical protein